MKKITSAFFRISIILLTSSFLLNCTSESDDENVKINTLNSQKNQLQTVTLQKSIDFFRNLNNNNLSKKSKLSNDINLKIDIESLRQVDITNTNSKLNIAAATTKFADVKTQILQIEINGELQTILLHQVSKKNPTSRMPIIVSDVIEDVYSTDIYGNVLSSYSIDNTGVTGLHIYPLYAKDPIPLNEVIVINNYKAPVSNNTNTMMSYQFVRSENNYSTMGLAYAAYYLNLERGKFDARIKSTLPECLQKILDKLKNTSSSPGNLICNFTNDWSITNYNWTVETGSLGGSIAETSSIYNMSTNSVTTIFDAYKWKEATDLSWARTMMHESIHAYLVTYFKFDRTMALATYSELVNEWGKKRDLNYSHHQEIARNLVPSIANALENYGVANGYNLSKEFYNDMAWSSLQETDAFKALPDKDQKRILDTIFTELTGADSEDIKKDQKGKKVGC